MRWLAALLLTLPLAAVDYLGEAEALRLAFPEADAFAALTVSATPDQVRTVLGRARSTARAKPGTTWVATRGGALVGTGYTDHVIGRTEYITWLCALGADGRIRRMEVLSYREPIGGEVAGRRWLEEFRGKGPDDDLRRGRPITNIAGATMSVDAMTERARFLLDWHAVVVAPELTRQYTPAPAPTTRDEAIPVGTSSLRLRLTPGGTSADQVATAIRTAAQQWNRVLNSWEAESEVAHLNQAGHGTVSPALAEVFAAIDGWHRVTRGRFDPTVGALVEAMAAGRAPPTDAIGWERVARQGSAVRFPAGLRLDVGGVMKGWILDAARAAAEPHLMAGQSLHLDFGHSSQLAVGGSVRLDLTHPADPTRLLETIELPPGMAIGAAHAGGRTFRVGTDERSHLINPKTGASAPRDRAAMVLAPSAALADALDTALCLLPAQEALEVAQQAGVQALIWSDGQWHKTPGWPGRTSL